MTLITTGKPFIRDLEKAGALGVYIPLEGGHEGRYQRRLRAAGYGMLHIAARGLGDLSSYMTGVHGVRPPHLGKKDIGQGAAVGARYFLPPLATYQLENLPPKAKGLVIWLIDGSVLTQQELEYLISLTKSNPKIKVVIELGGDRTFHWKSLQDIVVAA
jgi:NAD(P)H-quinone oxidoreductase subunit N